MYFLRLLVLFIFISIVSYILFRDTPGVGHNRFISRFGDAVASIFIACMFAPVPAIWRTTTYIVIGLCVLTIVYIIIANKAHAKKLEAIRNGTYYHK